MRTRQRPSAGRAAFTIVEAVVAMGIIGVLVLALYAGMASATFSIKLARENLRATEIMVEKAEALRLFTWEQLLEPGFVPTNFTAVYHDNGTTNKSGTGIPYTGSLAIVRFPHADRNYSNDMRVVNVNIAWKSGGVARSRDLTTWIGRYGIQNYVAQ